MQVKLIDTNNGTLIDAEISPAKDKDAPAKKNRWKFNWKQIMRTEGSSFFKIEVLSEENSLEGLLMLSVYFEELIFMNNLEIPPHNLGKNGKYDRVAGCLIAYGCLFSFMYGKGNYQGFLTFDSKTALVSLYREKYGANLASSTRMYIEPDQGKTLIEKYLQIDYQL